MIRLEDICKTYRRDGVAKVVADGLCLTVPPRKSVAILGRNGVGKSSLLRMIAGSMLPDRGRILVEGSVSWPVGFNGVAHGDLTGLQNTRFVARVHGVDSDELVASVEAFAELGQHYRLPVRTYSSGMRSRLAFALSMGIRFDTYLIDEVTSVGDAAFKAKSEAVLCERLNASGAIVVSHAMDFVKRVCTEGAVLENGKLIYYNDIKDAVRHHLEIVKQVRIEIA